MKSKFMSFTIATSLFITSSYAQEAPTGNQKKSYEQAIDTVIDQLKKFKSCVQGKKPCRPADFAVLGAGLLVIYGIVRGLRYQLTRGVPYSFPFKTLSPREKVGRLMEYTDPAYWSEEATRKTIKKIRGKPEPF